ncbi:TonB-dependent receptor [Rhizorhabdus argentea]|uniref:TonB-dependent receptor n=1 Tax=Rhizorhabdus argentea TaxID=1387174 RepID=UPI0030EB8A84
MNRKSILLGSACAVAVMTASPAAAQAVDTAQAPAAAQEIGGLEDIVVTAQKRSERLQDVPIAITAMTAESLSRANISSTMKLSTVVPGLVTYQTVASFQPFIRGVGSNIASFGLENPVAVYFDGVYLASKTAAVFELGAIERVEVIKGPQGTLFGRNATGGAISVSTRAPGANPEYSAEIGYGRYNEVAARASVAYPLSDTLRVMMSGSYRKDDGYIKDIVGGRTEGAVNQYAALAKIIWSPTDKLDVEATYLQYRTENNAPNMVHLFEGQHVALPAGTIVATGDYQSSWDFTPELSAESKVAFAKIKYELADGVDVVSISSYQKSKSQAVADGDRSSAPLSYAFQMERGHAASQELQLMSRGDGPFSWIGGLFYYRNVTRSVPTDSRSGVSSVFDPATLSGIPFVAPSVTRFYARIPTTSYAAFAQLTYQLSDADRVTAGIRYTVDKKTLTNQTYYVNKAGEEVAIAGRSADTGRTFKKPTWRFSYDRKFGEDILGYVSYNRGFKSGGYNPLKPASAAGQPQPVRPEVLDAYEAGIKSEFFNRRIRANISAFYYDYKNILVATIDGRTLTSDIANAASSRHYGFDADFTAAVTDNLSLRASGSYLHAKYRRYERASVQAPAPNGGAATSLVDASGANVIFAPKYTLTLGADYNIYISDTSRLSLSTTYYYNDGFDTQPLVSRTSISSWSNLSASMTWHLASDKYFVRIWGDNLTNERHPMFKLATAFGFGGVFAKPITYGASVGFNF